MDQWQELFFLYIEKAKKKKTWHDMALFIFDRMIEDMNGCGRNDMKGWHTSMIKLWIYDKLEGKFDRKYILDPGMTASYSNTCRDKFEEKCFKETQV